MYITYSKKIESKYPFIDPTYSKLQTVEVEKKGVLVLETKCIVYDPREEFKDAKYRDFSLENLIKLQSPLLNREVYLSSEQPDNVINMFEHLKDFNNVQAS